MTMIEAVKKYSCVDFSEVKTEEEAKKTGIFNENGYTLINKLFEK